MGNKKLGQHESLVSFRSKRYAYGSVVVVIIVVVVVVKVPDTARRYSTFSMDGKNPKTNVNQD